MKRRLVVCFTALVLLFPAIASAQQAIVWKPVCRHTALFWAITLAEDFPTRIKYGYFVDRDGKKYHHVQPQLYMGNEWWYFKIKNKHVTFISEPVHKIYYEDTGEEERAKWVPISDYTDFVVYVAELKTVHKKGPD